MKRAEREASTPPHQPVSPGVALAYAGITLPVTAVGLPIGVYLPPLYAAELGMGLASVGLVFMFARIWDVVTDPLMGIMIDRFPSRWGRRKHWILLGAPVLMLAAAFVYMPGRDPRSTAYLLGWLFVLYVGFTLLNTAHQAWGPSLARTYHDRSRLYGYREAVNIFGTISILSLPALLERLSEVDAFDRAASMGWYLLISLPVTVAIALYVVPDRVDEREEGATASPADIVKALSSTLLARLLFAEFGVALGLGVFAATFLFVAEWVFDLEAQASVILIAFFGAGVLALPGWTWLSRRTSKHLALICAAIYSGVAAFGYLLFAEPGSLASLLGLTAVAGIGFAAPQVLVRAMIADAVDAERLRHGQDRAGLYFSLMSMVYKLGNALSVGIAYLILDFVDFDPARANTGAAVDGLLRTFVLLPAAAYALIALALWRYPLTPARHAEIRAKLEGASP